MLGDADTTDALRLARALEQHDIRLLVAVPSHLRVMMDDRAAVAALRGVRQVAVSGEALTPSLAATLHARLPAASLLNGYGLTETTGMVTRAILAPADSVSIGTALSGMCVYVADHSLKRTPVGVVGEICVAGDQLARGYYGRPGVTAERFVPHPSGRPGERLFRTGDRARYEADGRITWQGREDDEVKVRGFRISLHDVELAIEAHASVAHAAVVTSRTVAGESRLQACVVPARGSEAFDVHALREALRATLPDHMVPSSIVIVEALPLLPNGKVDRVALAGGDAGPEPDPVHAPGGFIGGGLDIEGALAEMIADVLGVPMRPDAALADHGADSLSAMRLSARIADRLSCDIAVSDLMKAATVRELARQLGQMAPSLGTLVARTS
jgi:acyl-coenzyme A synthetase/AMP-(fatty) acid ligase/acyl carrier protein